MGVKISDIDLTGQVAIVTGGQAAIAQALEAAGAAVIVAEATDRETIVQTVQQVRDQRGPITLIVNTVDAAQTPVPLWQVDPGELSNNLETTLRSALLWMKVAIAEMAPGARIINIADVHTFSRLTSSLTLEAQAHGIEVISLDPGTLSDPLENIVVFLAAGRTLTTEVELSNTLWHS